MCTHTYVQTYTHAYTQCACSSGRWFTTAVVALRADPLKVIPYGAHSNVLTYICTNIRTCIYLVWIYKWVGYHGRRSWPCVRTPSRWRLKAHTVIGVHTRVQTYIHAYMQCGFISVSCIMAAGCYLACGSLEGDLLDSIHCIYAYYVYVYTRITCMYIRILRVCIYAYYVCVCTLLCVILICMYAHHLCAYIHTNSALAYIHICTHIHLDMHILSVFIQTCIHIVLLEDAYCFLHNI